MILRNSTQDSYIGSTAASQAAEAGSTPVSCSKKRCHPNGWHLFLEYGFRSKPVVRSPDDSGRKPGVRASRGRFWQSAKTITHRGDTEAALPPEYSRTVRFTRRSIVFAWHKEKHHPYGWCFSLVHGSRSEPVGSITSILPSPDGCDAQHRSFWHSQKKMRRDTQAAQLPKYSRIPSLCRTVPRLFLQSPSLYGTVVLSQAP